MYLPLVSVSQLNTPAEEAGPRAQEAGPRAQEGDGPPESAGTLQIRDELLNSTHKFLGHIKGTLQQLDGGSAGGGCD